MKDIRTQSNGYELTAKHQEVLNTWMNFIFEHMDVQFIENFYYGDKLVMSTVKLNDNNYGHFNITEKRISFNGHTCTFEELSVFESATWNDELFDGKVFK